MLITPFLLFSAVALHFVIADRLSRLPAWVNARARIAARNPHPAHPYSSPKQPKSVSTGEENWRDDTVSRSVLMFPESHQEKGPALARDSS